MKKILILGLIVALLVGCTVDKQVGENNKIDAVSSAAPIVVVVEEVEEVAEEVVEEVAVEEEPEEVEEEVIEVDVTYENIGAGYLFSEPYDDIYPRINEEDSGTYITIENGGGKRYLMVVGTEELKSYNEVPKGENFIEFLVEGERADLTMDEYNLLFDNPVYYLYEVK